MKICMKGLFWYTWGKGCHSQWLQWMFFPLSRPQNGKCHSLQIVPFSPLCKSLWKMISLNKPSVFVPQLFQFSLSKQIKTLWKWITHMWLYNSQVHPRCSVAEILLLVTDWGLTRFLPIANNSVKCYLRRGEAHNGFLRYSPRNHSFPHPWAPPIITVSDSGSAATSDKLFLDRYHTSG